jgi:hypothetical protein
MVIKPLMDPVVLVVVMGGMNMDDIFSNLVIFSVVPLEAVADLEAEVEASVELKEVTYQSKINFRRNC